MKLFITYASEDRPIADELAVRLRTEGYTVFLDRDNLPEGEGYDAQIRAAIVSCDLYLFLISPRSVQPGRYTLTELKFAREQFPNPRGRVLPVMIESTPFGDIPPYLGAVTVLQPQGNLVAETVAQVGAMLGAPRACPVAAHWRGSGCGSIGVGGAALVADGDHAHAALQPVRVADRPRNNGPGDGCHQSVGNRRIYPGCGFDALPIGPLQAEGFCLEHHAASTRWQRPGQQAHIFGLPAHTHPCRFWRRL